MIHWDGDSQCVREHEGHLDALRELKLRSLARDHVMFSETIEGGLRTVSKIDRVVPTRRLTTEIS